MFTETEMAQRESIGMNALWDHPFTHRPYDPIYEIMSRAILGSPCQRLRYHDICFAIRERFSELVSKEPWWPVSGRFFCLVSSRFQRMSLCMVCTLIPCSLFVITSMFYILISHQTRSKSLLFSMSK